MSEKAQDLARALANAEAAVKDFGDKLTVNEAAVKRAKFAATAALCGIVFDLLLTVLIGWGLGEVDTNQDRINELQTDQTIQTDRNRTAQCAVNALLLQFEPRTLANPAYTAEQREEQVRVYDTLRGINHDLGCK